eukprot:118544-Chlamydomonas_euryale.AAC.1
MQRDKQLAGPVGVGGAAIGGAGAPLVPDTAVPGVVLDAERGPAAEGDRSGDSAPDAADTGVDAECARCADNGTAGRGVGAVRKSGRVSKKPVNLTYFMHALFIDEMNNLIGMDVYE